MFFYEQNQNTIVLCKNDNIIVHIINCEIFQQNENEEFKYYFLGLFFKSR